MTNEQYKELFNILTPRMQKQLIESLHDLEPVHNNPADEPEHGDFTMKGNTLFLWAVTLPTANTKSQEIHL